MAETTEITILCRFSTNNDRDEWNREAMTPKERR